MPLPVLLPAVLSGRSGDVVRSVTFTALLAGNLTLVRFVHCREDCQMDGRQDRFTRMQPIPEPLR